MTLKNTKLFNMLILSRKIAAVRVLIILILITYSIIENII